MREHHAQLMMRLANRRRASEQMVESARQTLAVAAKFQDRVAEIRTDKGLSPTGQAKAAKDALTGDWIRRFMDVTRPIRLEVAHLRNMKADLGNIRADRNDLVREMRCQEIRAFLRSRPHAERLQLALSGVADGITYEAIVSASPMLSGLDAQNLAQLKRQYIAVVIPEQAADIEGKLEAAEEAEAIMLVARGELRSAVDLDPVGFDLLVAPIEAQMMG